MTLTIYDLSGRVIRTLDVGHRIASAYESQSKAIYWDGRNGLGEEVASGVYFYTLTAEIIPPLARCSLSSRKGPAFVGGASCPAYVGWIPLTAGQEACPQEPDYT